jgi:hypothetical protein
VNIYQPSDETSRKTTMCLLADPEREASLRRINRSLRTGATSSGGNSGPSGGRNKYDATSSLCTIVMLLFVAVEIPQCIFNILMAVAGEKMLPFYTQIEDVFEMFTIVYRFA